MSQIEFPLFKKFVDAYNGENPPRHLLFGDSVALRVADDDTCKDTLEDLVSAEIGDQSACWISHSAFHSQVFCLFCNCLPKLRHQPRSVIIPVNLRSFSPSWDLHPEYQFLWETAILDDFACGTDGLRQPIQSTPVAKAVFQAIPLHLPSGEIRLIGEFLEIIASRVNNGLDPAWKNRIRDIFTFHYLHNLYPTHRKLRYLGTAVKNLRRGGIGVGLYITPINYLAGTKYVDETFMRCVSSNVEMIENYLRDFGVNVIKGSDLTLGSRKALDPIMLNLAFECDELDFFTPHNATEHLRYPARKSLAVKIALLAKSVEASY